MSPLFKSVRGYSMHPIEIIRKYYNPESEAYSFLVQHSRMVAKRQLKLLRGSGI